MMHVYSYYLYRSYDSWIRCLSSEDRKNICPLTKKPLTKRELVVLTYDNIDEYRYVGKWYRRGFIALTRFYYRRDKIVNR